MARTCFILAAFAVSMGALGCEEHLGARAEYEDVSYSMYGVLSPELDTQSVRIYVPEELPTLGSPDGLDVEVRSTDLDTGEIMVWRDSVLVDPNGQYTYVYWSVFKPVLGRAYRIEAVGPRGRRSYAEVHVPPTVAVRIDESRAPILEVFVGGSGIRLLHSEAVYDVARIEPLLRYKVEYASQAMPVQGGWKVDVNMVNDAFFVNAMYNQHANQFGGQCRRDFVFLMQMEFHALVGVAPWNPNHGIFDPNVLSVPERLDNVENGFGFVGAGYRINEPLEVSRETVLSSCFRDGIPRDH